ncbi:MAG: hypothetical protein H8E34_06110 [Bacteroidetes bacterium]|nr:hypothetical protein [Bacteroidota bacterium]MBL6944578.1 hypothetical protein [Bacteroidales bacterium]
MKKLKFPVLGVFIAFVFVINFSSCSKDDNSTEQEEPEQKNLYVFNVSQESNWDYWIVGKNGDFLLVREQNNKPIILFYKPNQNYSGYTIYLDEFGLPKRVVIQNHIFLLGNYRDNLVDISVVLPNGEIKVVRDIETDLNVKSIMYKSTLNAEGWREIVKIAGLAAGVAACAIGVATAPAGIGIAISAIGCGATVLSVIEMLIPNDSEILGISSSTVGAVSTVVGCINPSSAVACVSSIISTASDLTLAADEYLIENEDEVRLAESVLFTGSGDIQVTLTWDNYSDLDLWVTDPLGEKIYWSNPTSYSGGELDFDDQDGFGPENIFWPENQAPYGEYLVQVDYYTGSGIAKFTILVQAFGDVGKYEGVLQPDETVNVVSFSSGSKGLLIKPLMNVNENHNVKLRK